MQIEKVYFQKNFQVGDFLYEHIGVGVILEAGESAKEALETAMQFVKEQHFEKHKEMYEQMGTKTTLTDSEGKTVITKRKAGIVERQKMDNAFSAGDGKTIEELNKIYDFA